MEITELRNWLRSSTRMERFAAERLPERRYTAASIVPLEPGDVISTGTPSGVGLGRNPQRWLRPDETMAIEIEGIGTLRNRTRALTV